MHFNDKKDAYRRSKIYNKAYGYFRRKMLSNNRKCEE